MLVAGNRLFEGVIVVALTLGVIEALVTGYVSSNLRDVAAFVILIAVLYKLTKSAGKLKEFTTHCQFAGSVNNGCFIIHNRFFCNIGHTHNALSETDYEHPCGPNTFRETAKYKKKSREALSNV